MPLSAAPVAPATDTASEPRVELSPSVPSPSDLRVSARTGCTRPICGQVTLTVTSLYESVLPVAEQALVAEPFTT